MGKSVLTEIEDQTLAMAEDEYVSFKTASFVLSRFHPRCVTYGELLCITGRHSSLGLIRWRIRQHGRWHFRRRALWPAQGLGAAQFIATVEGLSYLQAPRHVA